MRVLGTQRRTWSSPAIAAGLYAVVLLLLAYGILAGEFSKIDCASAASTGMAPGNTGLEAGLSAKPAVNPAAGGFQPAVVVAERCSLAVHAGLAGRVVRHPLTLAASLVECPSLYRRPPPCLSSSL